jgi:vacuolar iron transporter family protein
MSLPLHHQSSAPSLTSNIDLQSIVTTSVQSEEKPKVPSSKWTLDAKIVEDAVLGLSDGLTVPFALTAGLSVLGNSNLVVLGGLAELFAGMISMGLGGFVGAQSAMYVSS